MSTVAATRRRVAARPRHAGLWAVALLAFGLGDTATTAVGLSMGAPEANPILGGVVGAHGLWGIVGLKAGVLAVGAGAYALLPRPEAIGVPAGLAVLGVCVTAWNAAVLVVMVV